MSCVGDTDDISENVNHAGRLVEEPFKGHSLHRNHNMMFFRLLDTKSELNRSMRSSQSDKMFLETEVQELRRK